MALIQSLDIFPSGIAIKFTKTIKVSTLRNANFLLYSNTSTPVSIPFETIDVQRDFNSINRVITLYYRQPLTQDITYRILIQNLVDASGATIATEYYDYIPAGVTDPDIEDLESLVPDPIEIVDRSEQSSAFITSEKIIASNPSFYIVDTDPESFDLYVDPTYNSGRITIKFSASPDSQFLDATYFKVQKKLIQRTPSRWITVSPVIISKDATRPWVYVDLPSTGATPSYVTPGLTYYEGNYKYRIKISKAIGY